MRATPSSGSSSDESAPQAGHSSIAHPQKKTVPLPQGIKRKRDGAKSTSPPAPTRPMMMMRKVVSSSTNNQLPTSAAQESGPKPIVTQSRIQPSVAKPPGMIKMRRVQDKAKPVEEQSPAEENPPKFDQPDERIPPSTAGAITVTQSETPLLDVAPPSLPLQASESQSGFVTPDLDLQSQDLSPRRMTRSAKLTDPDAAFSTRESLIAKPKPRRKHTLPKSSSSSLSGMSALALKTLTITNTSKNQKQVAELQTEVVRKDGKRPDSPTTRVRSALEQQKEVRDQQRRERAERRAKRSSTEVDDTNEDGSIDTEDNSMNNVDDDASGNPLKHRRGPGDEEDYVTPERPARPSKKGRMDDDVENDDRHVRWDRGLTTTVFFDGSPPKPRHNRGIAALKGCLAPNAKVCIMSP